MYKIWNTLKEALEKSPHIVGFEFSRLIFLAGVLDTIAGVDLHNHLTCRDTRDGMVLQLSLCGAQALWGHLETWEPLDLIPWRLHVRIDPLMGPLA